MSAHYEVIVRGKTHTWSVPVPDRQAKAMEADGFEVIYVANSMPAWVVDIGFTRAWVLLEDIWTLPVRLWRKLFGRSTK